MTDIRFDRLTDLPLRDAWRHEALDFTPWLAQNIDHLSDAIGMPLELTGTEVAVESFSADILARNPMDDSVVLIENQLDTTDHTHLGQIMTYLAGLEAQTVIWIAPKFREPHLSAIRWLNKHTADGFSFFAVKARVLRIGDSPFAPIFEVVEKPNDWERRIREKERATKQLDPNSDNRHAFCRPWAGRIRTLNVMARLPIEPGMHGCASGMTRRSTCRCFWATICAAVFCAAAAVLIRNFWIQRLVITPRRSSQPQAPRNGAVVIQGTLPSAAVPKAISTKTTGRQ